MNVRRAGKAKNAESKSFLLEAHATDSTLRGRDANASAETAAPARSAVSCIVPSSVGDPWDHRRRYSRKTARERRNTQAAFSECNTMLVR